MRRRDREQEEVALGRCWFVSMNTTFRTLLARVCMRGEALVVWRVSLGDVWNLLKEVNGRGQVE